MAIKTFKLIGNLIITTAFISVINSCTNVNANKNAESSDSAVKIPISLYLQIMQSYLPAALCHKLITDPTFSASSKKVNMTDKKCIPLMAYTVQECIKNVVSNIPGQVDKNEARKWGANIGGCAGINFVANYLI